MIGTYDIGVLDKLKSARKEIRKRKEITSLQQETRTASASIANLNKEVLIACSNIRLSE